MGLSDVFVERALELKPGSLKRWRSRKMRPEEKALLKIIMLDPWMLDVADHKFDKMYSAGRLLIEASKTKREG